MMISFIIPTNNSEQYIVGCISSVVSLKRQENPIILEVVVVDNASQDGTINKVTSFIPDFKQLGIQYQIISEPDKGIYDAWNKGVQHASGDYLCFLGSDDYLANDFFESLTDVLIKQEPDVVTGGIRKIYSKTRSKTFFSRKQSDLGLRRRMEFKFPATFFGKEVFEELGGFDLAYRFSADYDFLFRIYASDVEVIYLPKVICNMRMVGVTNTVSNLKKIALEDFRLKVKNGTPSIVAGLFLAQRRLEIMFLKIRNSFRK